jgi:hypothetical protein
MVFFIYFVTSALFEQFAFQDSELFLLLPVLIRVKSLLHPSTFLNYQFDYILTTFQCKQFTDLDRCIQIYTSVSRVFSVGRAVGRISSRDCQLFTVSKSLECHNAYIL